MSPGAGAYQAAVAVALAERFQDVRVEWSVVTAARDAFTADVRRYAPRVDVAVGPFNRTPGPDDRLMPDLLPDEIRALLADLPRNPNPRCLLAIEIVFSGSSKHILGDIVNAGALGMYGIVVGNEVCMPKIRRIQQYLELLAELGKLPWSFRNVVILSTAEFDALLD
jgi:hypothetical protein